ncbi:MAG: hypothetical protein UE819_08820 [Ruminococcus sp.]|mgnify:FL=1|nr:hypothetical protein [Ruminococcus sp.]
MRKKHKISKKYWNLMNDAICEYTKKDEFNQYKKTYENIGRIHAACILREILDQSAPNTKDTSESDYFEVDEDVLKGLMDIIFEQEEFKDLIDYLKSILD